MLFAQELITEPLKEGEPIPVRPFRLDSNSKNQPSRFQFHFLASDNQIYDYGFELDSESIIEEWLYVIKKSNPTGKMLFHRNNEKDYEFGKTMNFETDDPEINELPLSKKKLRLQFVANDTRKNQLFLQASIERNQPYWRAVYDWFKNSLIIVRPETKYLETEFQIIEEEEFVSRFERLLNYFDTGIRKIERKPINVEKEFPHLLPVLEANIDEQNRAIINLPNGQRFAFDRKDGEIRGFKLMTIHTCEEGASEPFEINWESQGTQRLMDLIPFLFMAKKENSVLVIDELARSLHPQLTQKLVRIFLSSTKKRMSQLIFTTHEDFLLDMSLFRRDEIWFVEKNSETGSSNIYSLEEYKPRNDRDIRMAYLHGRFGATPNLEEQKAIELLEY
jgi:hypothetical protein